MLRQYFPDPRKFVKLSMAVGRVARKEVEGRAEVSVNLQRFNEYFCIYFPESSTLQVHDPGDKCSVGDYVLIKKLPEKRLHVETHQIQEIVHKVGNIIDPMTGYRVEGNQYLLDSSLSEDEQISLEKDVADKELSLKYTFEMDTEMWRWESRNLARKPKKS
ncbi:small ribosomal subunit protein uS17m-like [Styela clava]|uniref:28S ribosomal protein S17, mitochondrial-like n=1 Tax=Styela clava TaxID=7725 RepID=UPI00193A4D38|nr:28S ribosomal protein S17, mitochondrial-like [Styela clava]